MTLAEEVVALQARLADAERARARAEGARDNAQTILDSALAELKEQFDVDDPEQAAALLVQMREQLTYLVASICERLDQIGV